MSYTTLEEEMRTWRRIAYAGMTITLAVYLFVSFVF